MDRAPAARVAVISCRSSVIGRLPTGFRLHSRNHAADALPPDVGDGFVTSLLGRRTDLGSLRKLYCYKVQISIAFSI